jgi:zinc finger CCHC domain-containing protein 9
MTRVTNVGRKRNYIEAGFSPDEKPVAEPSGSRKAVSELKDSCTKTGDVDLPPKKKRKRTKRPKSKMGGDSGKSVVEARESDEDGKGAMLRASDAEGESASTNNPSSMSKTMERGRDRRGQKGMLLSLKSLDLSHSAFPALVVSERRRKQRIIEKLSVTICFACRAKGHTAKDCPKTKALGEEGDNMKPKSAVGICYRSAINSTTTVFY